jgi:hypothetical protein
MSQNLSAKNFSKIKFGGYIWTYKDQFAIFFLDFFSKKFVSAYMEKMVKKVLKVCLTQLIIIQIEKNFKFFPSIVDGFD